MSFLVLKAFIAVLFGICGYHLTPLVYTKNTSHLRSQLEKLVATNYNDGNWTDDENLFYSYLSVELVARSWLYELKGEKRPGATQLELMRQTFERGDLEFPDCRHLKLLAAKYYWVVFNFKAKSYELVRDLPFLEMSLDFQILIFIHLETERKEHQLEFLAIEERLEISLENDYARIVQVTRLNHYLSLLNVRKMWSLVLKPDYDTHDLESISENLHISASKVMHGYDKLIEKYYCSKIDFRSVPQYTVLKPTFSTMFWETKMPL